MRLIFPVAILVFLLHACTTTNPDNTSTNKLGESVEVTCEPNPNFQSDNYRVVDCSFVNKGGETELKIATFKFLPAGGVKVLDAAEVVAYLKAQPNIAKNEKKSQFILVGGLLASAAAAVAGGGNGGASVGQIGTVATVAAAKNAKKTDPLKIDPAFATYSPSHILGTPFILKAGETAKRSALVEVLNLKEMPSTAEICLAGQETCARTPVGSKLRGTQYW